MRRQILLRTSLALVLAPFGAFALVATAACGDESPTDPTGGGGGTGRAVSLEATPATVSFTALGDSAQLAAVVRDAAGNEIPGAVVAWTNTDAAVATVNAAGWVVAQSNGTAAVVASAGSLADTVPITVAQVVAALEVSPSAVSVGEGDTVRLVAAAADSNGVAVEGAAVEWVSEDEGVATVDGSGLVTGVGWGGETRITATAAGLSGQVTVSVPDQLVFHAGDDNVDIYRINADGSGLTRLTFAAGDDAWPTWSPDGGRIAFRTSRDANEEIYVMNADGSDPTNVTNDAGDDYRPSWSPDGMKIAFESTRDGNYEVYVVNADGSGLQNLTNDPGADFEPVWSPDGKRIAFYSHRDGDFDIHVMAADGSELMNLTNDGGDGDNVLPRWSPDGTRIAFVSNRDGDYEIYVMNSDGSGLDKLTDNDDIDNAAVWSPDGSRIALTTYRDGNYEIHVVNADGSSETNLTNHPGQDALPVWSPDGERIAFASDRDGDYEIYVVHADGSGLTRLTDAPGDDVFPAWRPRP
ncbi:MAG TPA: Ig-like domain-containing protein [Longimicrobiales bacterium]